MQKAIDEFIRRRAGNVCEYCRFPLPPFHIEHIVARKHGGPTLEHNLALACMKCNFHKGTNLSGIDPVTGNLVRLFHPRKDNWTDHFRWENALLVGITAEARATIGVLEMNNAMRVQAREQLIIDGRMQI
jgi:hypothetical protein